MFPRSRSDIHNTVRYPHGIFIVLDHKHGISKVAQMCQGRKKLVVVALMQADRIVISPESS